MNVTVRIPDDLVPQLQGGGDVARQALEGLALESFRAGRINKDDLALMLGLDGHDQVDGFLKDHDVFEPCAIEDIVEEVEMLKRLGF